MGSLSNRCSAQWGGEVFVRPSDSLGLDGAAATWRWNVNTLRLSAAPPHICLHPSIPSSPIMPLPGAPLVARSSPHTIAPSHHAAFLRTHGR